MARKSAASSTPEVTLAERWKTLVALAFGYFIDQGEGQTISVLFPTIQKLWGLDYQSLGLIGTIRSLLQALSAPFWGYAADKMSRKRVIIFGTGLWGIWTLICGFTQNFGQLLVIRAISGLGLGCLIPATFSPCRIPFRASGRALGCWRIGVMGIVIGRGAGLGDANLWLGILSARRVQCAFRCGGRAGQGANAGAAGPDWRGNRGRRPHNILLLSDVRKCWQSRPFGLPSCRLAGSMPWVVLGLYLITWMVDVRG